ncbi:MAG: hypothetical protein P8Y40_07065 [Desulfobacterales bacterium]
MILKDLSLLQQAAVQAGPRHGEQVVEGREEELVLECEIHGPVEQLPAVVVEAEDKGGVQVQPRRVQARSGVFTVAEMRR